MSEKELKLVLPPELKNFFAETGYTESTYFESRRNGRLRIRAVGDITLSKNLAFAATQRERVSRVDQRRFATRYLPI